MYIIVAISIFFLGIYALIKSRKIHYWQLKVLFLSCILAGPLIVIERYFKSIDPSSKISVIFQGLLLVLFLFVFVWLWVMGIDSYKKRQIPMELEDKLKVVLFAYPFLLLLVGAFIFFLLFERYMIIF